MLNNDSIDFVVGDYAEIILLLNQLFDFIPLQLRSK
ncbi:hypothetical protein FOLKNPGA_02125 [Legionella sp. PC1000]|nr:hypothetical protein FOLKNPGA_02125 [Legionella sp. PC1000]